ncbi:MAG: flagellar biosynthetic protein FliR [Hyphomicrobiales bacterium]|nr:flagellar biosynthetic protein FliR [Hyphomicrobiales bacterium]
MTPALQNALISYFVIFCRIGGCFMLAPGLSSARITPRIRLFAALSLSAALAPSLMQIVQPLVVEGGQDRFIGLIATETLTGAALGLTARALFFTFEMAAAAISQAIGLSSSFAPRIDDNEQAATLTAFLTLGATTLFFVAGFHVELTRAIFDSYSAVAPGSAFSAGALLSRMTVALRDSSLVALRIAAPFFVLSLLTHLAIGLVNRAAPQVAIYFVAAPLVMAIGLGALYLLAPTMLSLFLDFQAFLIERL